MNPQVFTYGETQVRTIIKNGEVWFIAKDVCSVLDIKNSRDALGRLDEDEKGVVLTDTLGGKQQMLCVNEAGLYESVKTLWRTFFRFTTGVVNH
ncbi:BRO-N domain-containing protein [Geobacillus sp. FSL W8-1251]|uniref:BRO-N domain-containing protein n=1 Tax=Geobacillus sp. FSL W8-1251 TaxID=2954650 RepID=UPI0030F67EA1